MAGKLIPSNYKEIRTWAKSKGLLNNVLGPIPNKVIIAYFEEGTVTPAEQQDFDDNCVWINNEAE